MSENKEVATNWEAVLLGQRSAEFLWKQYEFWVPEDKKRQPRFQEPAAIRVVANVVSKTLPPVDPENKKSGDEVLESVYSQVFPPLKIHNTEFVIDSVGQKRIPVAYSSTDVSLKVLKQIETKWHTQLLSFNVTTAIKRNRRSLIVSHPIPVMYKHKTSGERRVFWFIGLEIGKDSHAVCVQLTKEAMSFYLGVYQTTREKISKKELYGELFIEAPKASKKNKATAEAVPKAKAKAKATAAQEAKSKKTQRSASVAENENEDDEEETTNTKPKAQQKEKSKKKQHSPSAAEDEDEDDEGEGEDEQDKEDPDETHSDSDDEERLRLADETDQMKENHTQRIMDGMRWYAENAASFLDGKHPEARPGEMVNLITAGFYLYRRASVLELQYKKLKSRIKKLQADTED